MYKSRFKEKILVCVGVPYTKNMFVDLYQSDKSDFIESLKILYKEKDIDVLWKKYRKTAKSVKKTLVYYSKYGAKIVNNIDFEYLQKISDFNIVIFVAHRPETDGYIEYNGRLIGDNDFVANLSPDYKGYLDITSCYSKKLKKMLENNRASNDFHIVTYNCTVGLVPVLMVLRMTLQIMVKRGISYNEAHNTVLRKLEELAEEGAVVDKVSLGRSDEMYFKAKGELDNVPITYQPIIIQRNRYTSRLSLFSKILGRNRDMVYCSTFAPREVKRRSHLLIQVFLHRPEGIEEIKQLAKGSDKEAEHRDFLPLQCMLNKGDQVDVIVNVYGESLLMSTKKSIFWKRPYAKCLFDYYVPNDIFEEELSCNIILLRNGVPIGDMFFKTIIVESPREFNTKIIARKYNKIFISYSHKDESKVKYIAEAYRAARVDYFYDRHYLKAGDVFPIEIRNYIMSADLFILCWSENAAKSEYVEKERSYALERMNSRDTSINKDFLIYPISIQPTATLPADMKDTYNFCSL